MVLSESSSFSLTTLLFFAFVALFFRPPSLSPAVARILLKRVLISFSLVSNLRWTAAVQMHRTFTNNMT
jgi:hypothetical protein